mgnify:CR=1 FL=1
MYTIEKIGGGVLETWMGRLAMALLVVVSLYLLADSLTQTVTLDGKHFACTATESFGIEARCTQYTWITGVR